MSANLDTWRTFGIDAAEALRALEESLLELETDPTDREQLNRLYRGLHTLKGNSGFLELRQVETLAHAAEDLIGLVRDKGVPLDDAIVEAMLATVDLLRDVCDVVVTLHQDVEPDVIAERVADLRELVAERRDPNELDVHDPTIGVEMELWDDLPEPSEPEPEPVEDPDCVALVLALAEQALGAVATWEAEPAAPVPEICRELASAADGLGLVRVVDAVEALGAAAGGDVVLAVFALHAALMEVERYYQSLPGSSVQVFVGPAWRARCAAAAPGDLGRLRAFLDAPEADYGAVGGALQRLAAACEHQGLDNGARRCGELQDVLLRRLDAGQPVPGEALREGRELADHLEAAFAAPEGGGDVPAPPPDPNARRVHEEIGKLPLSRSVRSQMSAAALDLLAKATHEARSVYELAAPLDDDAELEAAVRAVVEAPDTQLVTSANELTDDGERTARYRFLFAAPVPPPELAERLAPALTRAAALGVPVEVLHLDGGAATPVALPEVAAPARAGAEVAKPKRSEGGAEPTTTKSAEAESLRIDATKVSLIMDLAGELGLAAGAVTRHPELDGLELEGFAAAAHKLEMLVRELQNEVSSLRLVAVAGAFKKMRRVVRDAARRTGKKVELVLVGEDTEIDKVMVDQLADPLVHLVRNAIDHGIEPPEERERLGKPTTGRIVLEASHQGGEVQVRVSDDGRGLDLDRILARARERGLVAPDAVLSAQEVVDLVFLPGFSTKETIDELSGRGVGMDVIRTTIEGLRGRVGITTTKGRGSRTTMTVPLTLAFVDAMVVSQAERLFALPIERVFEVFKADAHPLVESAADGRTLIRVRDELYPLLWLDRFYGAPAGAPPVVDTDGDPDAACVDGRVIVVVQSSQGGVALPVDSLLGNQQIMLKPLKGLLSNVRAAAGCGMLRSGDVALALDCEQLYA